MTSFILLSLIFITGLVLVTALILWRHLHRRFFLDSLRQELFLVRLPRRAPAANADPISEINQSAQLFSLLAAFKKPFTLEAAVAHLGEDIHFFLAISKSVADAAVRQLHGLWPEASVQPVSDFNIFNPDGAAAAVYCRLRYSQSLPLRTYREIGGDSFAPILSGLSKINEIGEGAAFQLVVRPVSDHQLKKQVLSQIDSLKQGRSAADVFGLNNWFKEFSQVLLSSSVSSDKTPAAASPIIIDEDLVKALNDKISRPLFEVNLRVIASAANRRDADSILNGITAGLSQLSAPKRNELKSFRPRRLARLLYNFSFRLFDAKTAFILNSDELASLFHFPTALTDVPRVSWLKAREAAPPVELSRIKTGVLLGASLWRGESAPVYLSDDDRRRHLYVIGQTGTGKSTLLTNMVISDIKRGLGVALIDPHGDLVETVAGLVPDHRLNDVVIFDPGEFRFPLGLNLLEYDPSRPEEKSFIVTEIQSIFNRLFPPDTMGPMFEQYMRNALLLLMEDSLHEPATLVEVPRVFTDTAFRRRKLARIHNPSVIDFWEKEAARAGGEAALNNITPYITSKFNNFIANDHIRPIIGQVKSAFSFRRLMDEGKILLVNLSKGRLGEINAGLLGMIITGKILLAALSRADQTAGERRDFNLYIDEFQNFTTDSIAVILSEARKYRLNLALAHQFIAQLTDKIREAIFGNVGSMISFRVGATDAEVLAKQFAPVFSVNDLINQDNFNAYVRLLINGQPSLPFNLRTLPSEYGHPARAHHLKTLIAEKYGRPLAEVEAGILTRLRS